ncbi:MAG TPA: hypothetical protein VF861_14500 [Telluria sp.]
MPDNEPRADRITVLFTCRARNPISWLIRWTVPRSRFALALSSHCLVDAGDVLYEATMLYGVREVDRATALRGATVVKQTRYQVPDAAAGLAWARSQLCRYEPKLPAWFPAWVRPGCSALLKLCNNNYDWGGAAGLGLAPGREWADESAWYCYEFVAGVLRAAGRPVFAQLSHVGETALMAIDP